MPAREVDVACLTLLVYDYLCTLKEEAEYIWPSRWSIGETLYYLNRYLVFIDQVLLFYFVHHTAATSETKCERIFKAAIWVFNIGENISTVILFLQTYAIWGGKWYIVYPLGLAQLAKIVMSLVSAHFVWDFASYSILQSRNESTCMVTTVTLVGTLVRYRYILFTVSEALSVCCTLVRARYHLKKSKSSWVAQLYRNGIMYSVVVLAFSIANVIFPRIPWKDPRSMIGILSKPQRVLDSVLCSRVMFVIFKNRQISSSLTFNYDDDLHESGRATTLAEHAFTTVHSSNEHVEMLLTPSLTETGPRDSQILKEPLFSSRASTG